VITGGARGQGRSHALALAGEGADIALFDITANIQSVPYSLGTLADLEETRRMVQDLDRRCETAV
jgi:NAD(P)-dependent dehydrogenase (short-subunit alcohol dehydrogenase family)